MFLIIFAYVAWMLLYPISGIMAMTGIVSKRITDPLLWTYAIVSAFIMHFKTKTVLIIPSMIAATFLLIIVFYNYQIPDDWDTFFNTTFFLVVASSFDNLHDDEG